MSKAIYTKTQFDPSDQEERRLRTLKRDREIMRLSWGLEDSEKEIKYGTYLKILTECNKLCIYENRLYYMQWTALKCELHYFNLF